MPFYIKTHRPDHGGWKTLFISTDEEIRNDKFQEIKRDFSLNSRFEIFDGENKFHVFADKEGKRELVVSYKLMRN